MEKAFIHVSANEALDYEVRLSGDPEEVSKAGRVVLPGQGAFPNCMKALNEISGMREALEERVIKKARPYLGICIGMQLMASRGHEHGRTEGLGWVPGDVVALKPGDINLKIPHMGWNEVRPPVQGQQDNRHFVLRSVKNTPHYYFVHSFMFKCKYDQHILGVSDYGGIFPAIIGRDNMIGVQFHPEKSQQAGLRLISDFLHWKP